MKTKSKFAFIFGLIILFVFSNITAQTTSVYVAAHPDDWQLFMNPNAYHSIKGENEKVIFLHVTAGDGGGGTTSNFYLAREEGSLRAIRFMSNTFTNEGALGNNMNQNLVTVNGRQLLKFSYRNAVAYFLRLPDGNYDGNGYPLHHNNSVQKLFNGSIASISAIDESATYSSLADLEATLQAIVTSEMIPSSNLTFHVADNDLGINPDDHSDHIYSSLLMQDVANNMGGVKLNLYSEYSTSSKAQNVFNDDYLISAGTWGATASGLSDSFSYSTWDNGHNVWLGKQYFRTVQANILPIASVVATDADAAENPLDTGTFTVSLNSINTGSPITINYTMSGTATPDSDYIALSGTLSIPNGQQSETITLTPIDDTEVEPLETAILTLSSAAGYTVGTSSNATVNITSDDLGPINENVALNKPTSSSSGAERASSNAVDGINALDNWWGASPSPQWWKVDLGAEYNLSKLVIYNYYDGTRYYQYDIQASLDGTNWATLVDFNANTSPATNQGNTFNLNETSARYIRVNMNYNSANIGVHIIEFEAYGTLAQVFGKNSPTPTNSMRNNSIETSEKYSLMVYPNPNKSGAPLNLSLNLLKDESASVEIFDVNGNKISGKDFDLKKGFNEVEVPTNYFSTGILFVKVDIQGEVMTKRILLE